MLSLIVTPEALTVLLPVPAFLSVNACEPALFTLSPAACPAKVPTVPVPVAVVVPSYVFVTAFAATLKSALLTVNVPPT